MKDDQKVIEGFKAVDFMRKTRDKISSDIAAMSFEEIKKYLKKRRESIRQSHRPSRLL